MTKKKHGPTVLKSFDDLDAAGIGAGYRPSFVSQDQPTPDEAPRDRSLLRTAGDYGISALKGAIGVPEAVVGLADIPTGGRVGQALESIGFRPKDAKAYLNDQYSDQQKQAFQNVGQAEGFGGKFVAALQNPSVITHGVVESLPSMGAGGVVGRGIMAAAPRVSGALAAGVGEGVIGGGSAAEQIRQETPDGLLTPAQAGLAVASGLGTTAFGVLGNKVAKSLGIHDVDTMLVSAATNPAAAKGVVRRVLEGAASEGILEELPQSIQEQVLQNVALGKDLTDGVDQAAVLGMLSGAAMGGGANILGGGHQTTPATAADPVPPAAAAPLALPAPVITVGPDGTAQTVADRQAARDAGPLARAATLAANVTDVVAKPGALARAASTQVEPAPVAINSGVNDAGQNDQAPSDAGDVGIPGASGAELSPVGEPTPAAGGAGPVAGGLPGSEAPITADDIAQHVAAKSQPAAKGSPEVAAPPQTFATYDEADAYRREQKQRGTSVQALPVPTDGGFTLAVKGSPEYPAAEKLREERRAAKERADAGILDGDILNKLGKPFTIRLPAANAVKANPGFEVVAVQGGFVARKAAPTTQAKETPTDVPQPAKTPEETSPAPGAQAAPEKPAAVAPAIAGAPINKEWTAFSPESGTKSIPRADMPQIKAEHRGAMVNFLNARGIAHEQVEIPAGDLKPTQAEFSPAKVELAKAFEGGDRSILVSADGHVLDGHHQWLAKMDAGEPVKAIRLDAAIGKLLEQVKEFPSAEVATGAPPVAEPAIVEHTTGKGKLLRGMVRTDLSKEEATALDPYTFKKNGGWFIRENAEKQPVEQAEKAQAALKNVAKPAAKSKAAATAKTAALADYFAPGNILKGYSGHDRVISYTPATDGAQWTVKVQAVVKRGDAWVNDSTDDRERNHSTEPDDRQLRAGPVQRAAVQEEKSTPKPSANTIFTEDAAAAARARLKSKLGRLNSGIDPETLMDGITLAGYHIERGARSFAAYAKAMVADLGEGVKPFLKSWYMGVKFDPRATAFDGMDSAASVEAADLDAAPQSAASLSDALYEAIQATGTHKDPGEPTEAATPSVVDASMAKAAEAEGRKPSAMRAELLGEIDQAIQDAPDYPDFAATVKTMGEKDAVALFTTDARSGMGEKYAPQGYSRPTRTFDIEGDGKFTIRNTVRQLLRFRKSVTATGGFRDAKSAVPALPRTTDALDKRGHEATIKEMLAEGDYQAAEDFAAHVEMAGAQVDALVAKLDEKGRAGFAAWKAGGEPAQDLRAERRARQEAAFDNADAETETTKTSPDGKSAVEAAKKSTPAASKIDDFGEKLAGARKDYAALLTEATTEDIAVVPLSKSWPEPDYQKLLDAGSDKWTVAFLRAARDAVPTKPQTSWKLQRWVSQVETVRNMAEKLLTGAWKRDAVEPFVAAGTMRSLDGSITLYLELGHTQSLKGLSLAEHSYSLYKGQQYSPPKSMWTIEQKAKATAFGNWPRELATGDTRAQAIAAIKAKIDSTDMGPKPKGQTQFEIYRRRATGGDYIIGKKIGREHVDLKQLPDLAAARKFMAENAAELEVALARYKETPLERRPDNQPRVGDDHRNGAPVSPDAFASTFGFRGVQFGNYVEQGRRQSDLNETYDALMDLAAVLGVPARSLSLNGRLGLAFGARGKGGKGAPAAHYEPDTVVINLTKGGGPGSLAHEWWHSLDNYFAKDGGSTGFATDGARIDKLRAEMQAAFNAVRQATQLKSLRERSRELDKRKSKPYWNTPLELSARSFETYVIAKLQDQGAANDYLANVVGQEAWDVMEEARAAFFGESGTPSYPYPTTAELPAVRAGFDYFFRAVQTREDDAGNVAMFSRGYAVNGLPVAEVQREVDEITSKWANAPKVVVVSNIDDPRVPEAVRAERDKRQSLGAAGAPRGVFLNGTVYLLADQLPTPAHAAITLFHESLGHAGLRGTFGDALNPILQQIADLRRADVAEKAQEYNLDLSKPQDRLIAAEEVLAEWAQRRPDMGYVKRAIAAVRNWFRNHIPGFKNMVMTDDEIVANYLIPARGWVERGGVEHSSAEKPQEPMFSRADAGVNNPSDFRTQSAQAVRDMFQAPGTVNWWHATVGTMHNLAKRSPQFGRVFNAVQDFLGDVSAYATEAADLAPTLLPKLETWRDIGKSPISAADTKAIAAPIFEGTLSWARDEDGKAVRVQPGAEGDKAGIVFTNAELKTLFKLTPEQTKLYREFRASTDQSLNRLGITEILRFGGKDVEALRGMALDAGTAQDAAGLLEDHLLALAKENPDRADVLQASAQTIAEKADKIQSLIDQGYAPLSRFGHFTVDVLDEKGERAYFGMFESKAEANRMARQMRENYPQGTIAQGTVSEQAYKMFSGITPETLELFGEMVGLESTGDTAQDQMFQEYLKLAKANRSAMKRLIHRKGIAGFSEDAGRVLAGFVYSNARLSSTNLHTSNINQSTAAIPKGEGEVKDMAIKLADYVRNPQEEAQQLRGLMFAQYLGGSVASAMVNMTQPVTVTMPYLSQWGGAMKAAGRMRGALADVLKKSTGDAKLDAALKKAADEGIVAPQEVHQLMAQAAGRGALQAGDGTFAGDLRAKAGNALSKVSLAWGKPFAAAEQFNRRVTFIAAWRTAIAEGIANPAKFAEEAIRETQFVYNKGNKPQWARGAIGGTLFTFKQYSISYMELMHRMYTQGGPEGKRAVLLAMAMLFLVGGSSGLPFVGDAEDVVDGVMQSLGYSFSSKQARRQFFIDTLGEGAATFVERGISGLPGVPIDVAGRLGMGNLIPGTGLLTKKADHGRDVAELLGPAGDLAQRAFQGAGQIITGDPLDGLGTMSPAAIRNLQKSLDMYQTGMYRDQRGRKVIDVDGYDALVKAIGFQPTAVARVQDAVATQQNMIAQNKMMKTELADSMAAAMFEQDAEAQQSVRDRMRRWNASNPSSPVTIDMLGVRRRLMAMRASKAERIAKSAPKAIRADVQRSLAEGSV